MFEFKENVMFDNLSDERKKAFARLGLKSGDNITEIFKNLLKEENRTLEYYFSDDSTDKNTFEKEINLKTYFEISEKLLDFYSDLILASSITFTRIVSKKLEAIKEEKQEQMSIFKEIVIQENENSFLCSPKTDHFDCSNCFSDYQITNEGVLEYA